MKRPNTSVRARSGYFAPSPDDTLRAALLAQLNQPKPVVPLEPAPHVSPLIRAWFGTTRGDRRKDARDVRVGTDAPARPATDSAACRRGSP